MASGSWSSWGTTRDCAYIAKPTRIEAVFVIRTWGRTVTRRSTSGSLRRSSHQPQAGSSTSTAAKRVSVVALPQPQSAPLETASSRQIRAAPRPTAPSRSKLVDRVAGRSPGTRARISAPTATASTATTQNSTRQLLFSAMAAANGRPSAPPTPIEALMIAMDGPSFSAGTTSRNRLMPSGTTPMPRPWRARPPIIGTTDEDRAQTTEPRTSGTSETSSMRRLPYMSPSRPATGVATAAASRVAVITQEAFDAEVSNSFGSSAISGTTRVWVSAATMPAKARMPTTAPGRAAGGELSTGAAPSCPFGPVVGSGCRFRSFVLVLVFVRVLLLCTHARRSTMQDTWIVHDA